MSHAYLSSSLLLLFLLREIVKYREGTKLEEIHPRSHLKNKK